MAKRVMKEEQMIDVIWGATLLGGGGGGSMQSGIDLLDKYKEDHPNAPLEILIYDVDEMDPNSYAAVTAGMGAPTAIKGTDFSAYATNAFVTLQEMAARMEPARTLEYSFAVELGGFNTFVPMLIALVNDIPLIDADGAGRAVPALNTLLLHINGCQTSPLAMADGENNKLTIEMADPYNAIDAEEIGRYVTTAFNMVAGLSGWMIRKDDIKEKLPLGTINLSEKIGRVLRESANGGKDVFLELSNREIVDSKSLCKGEVVKTENLMEKGFDYGNITISSGKDQWIIDYQNENLVIGKNGKAIMTLPDIIATYDADTGKPLTNADIKEGMNIVVGAIKANEKWWYNPDMFDMWKPFLERVAYEGENIPFSK